MNDIYPENSYVDFNQLYNEYKELQNFNIIDPIKSLISENL